MEKFLEKSGHRQHRGWGKKVLCILATEIEESMFWIRISIEDVVATCGDELTDFLFTVLEKKHPARSENRRAGGKELYFAKVLVGRAKFG